MTLFDICRWVAAIIMLQTLFFKFSAAPESVFIFSTLGAEPAGRIGTGIIELIASALLILPRTAWIGAGLGCGLMLGAIGSHLFVLGISVQQDGGKLFGLAVLTLLCCGIIVYQSRQKLFSIFK